MTDPLVSFKQLLGQEKAKDLLKRSRQNGKIAHAYLFRGPAGVGKKTAARAMAASINCHEPDQDHDLCGCCVSCRKFQAGTHPDFQVIRPEGTMIKIQQIRALKQAISFPPFEADHRLILLEDVQTMRREAANSLLKTLEEPPPRNILVLTADEAGELLPTIVSRCQVIPFHALPYEQVSQALMTGADLPAETAQTLAAVSEGSLGRAKTLHEHDLLSLRREIINGLLACQAKDPEAIGVAFLLAEKAAELKEEVSELLGLLKTWFRDLLLVATNASTRLLINQDLSAATMAAGSRWNARQLFDKLRLIERAEKELLRNCNRSLTCEMLFLQLI